MKNLFNFLLGVSNEADTLTLEPAPAAVATPAQPTYAGKYPAIVEEIHHSFHTAGDKLLAEAQAVIAGTDESSFAKADRLKSLGFSQAKGVQEVAAVKQQVAVSKTTKDLLLEYFLKYPTYRFIDEAGIKAICAKYNLVFGCISDYKGFVPAKNLAEIEKAPWKPTLKRQHRIASLTRKTWQAWQDDNLDTWREYIQKHADYAFTGTGYGNSTLQYQFRDCSSFLICAPVKDMDMEGKTLEGHKVVNIEIPDPVVLHPMGNGLYAILSAWGNESSDPLVVNQQLN